MGRKRSRARPAASASPQSAARARSRRTFTPPPPVLRDPWAWGSMFAVVPALIHAAGTPLGEPFADDFLFLHRALLSGRSSWMDGGGADVYWRPLARQAYYGALGPLMLSQPAVV